jgi:uncharacterized iron-regulated membrane protein
MSWYRWLLYTSEGDDRPMPLWVSIAGLIFIVELIIGFLLWMKLKYKFHIGDFIGWPIKILWVLISLIPCFFVLSGIYLCIKRKPTSLC